MTHLCAADPAVAGFVCQLCVCVLLTVQCTNITCVVVCVPSVWMCLDAVVRKDKKQKCLLTCVVWSQQHSLQAMCSFPRALRISCVLSAVACCFWIGLFVAAQCEYCCCVVLPQQQWGGVYTPSSNLSRSVFYCVS
jgi:hypothetical protein